MTTVTRRTVGAQPRALPTELKNRIPGMTEKDAGILSLFAHVLGDITVRYDDYVIAIIDRRITGVYRAKVAAKSRPVRTS